jgi:Neuraminidase (sialidase)
VPQIATDGRGTWVAVWWSDDTRGKDYDVAVARSDDHGRTWTAPQVLNTNAGTDGGDDRCPFVATDGRGRWLTVWESTEKLGGTIGPDKEILVARSDDGGRIWTAPAAIDGGAATDADIDAEPRIAADGNGTWIAVWHATRVERGMLTAESRILAARSSDGGITWGPPTVLDAAPDSTGKPSDLQPVIVTDRAGHWRVAWWERLAPERGPDGASSAGRIVVVGSTDGGRSWSAPQACAQPGADPRAPDVAARGPDDFVLAWEAGPHPNAAAKGARTIHVRSGVCGAPRPKPRRTLRK